MNQQKSDAIIARAREQYEIGKAMFIRNAMGYYDLTEDEAGRLVSAVGIDTAYTLLRNRYPNGRGQDETKLV